MDFTGRYTTSDRAVFWSICFECDLQFDPDDRPIKKMKMMASKRNIRFNVLP